jgi:type I restriction enzyme S subunit
VDRAVQQTETLIAKQLRIKTGLMQTLLSCGIDEHSRVRSDITHGFQDSSFGRIPVEWTVTPLGQVANIIDPNPSHRYPTSCDSGVPITSTENFEGDNDFDLTDCENVPWSVFDAQFKRCQYGPTDAVFARKGRLGFARPYGHAQKVFSHTIVMIKAKPTARLTNGFLLSILRDHEFFAQIDKRMNSNSGVPTLGVQFLAAIPVRLPEPAEQERIVQVLSQAEIMIQKEQKHLRKLRALKFGLMQELLSGAKRVTGLLEPETKREKMYA